MEKRSAEWSLVEKLGCKLKLEINAILLLNKRSSVYLPRVGLVLILKRLQAFKKSSNAGSDVVLSREKSSSKLKLPTTIDG